MPLPLGFWRLGLSRDAYDACNASGTGGAAWNNSRLGWLPRSWPEQAESPGSCPVAHLSLEHQSQLAAS